MTEIVYIARCPEHGLHGERDECFVCGGPVERVAMTLTPAEPVYEWRAVNRHGLSVGFSVNESHAREWQQENPQGSIERRVKPGPWERVDDGGRRDG